MVGSGAFGPQPQSNCSGYDLATADAGPGLVPQLRAALRRHRLLVFPRQHLNHSDLLAACGLFGTVDTEVDRNYAAAPGFVLRQGS